MAAVKKWKRPWEDQDDEDNDLSKQDAPDTSRFLASHIQQMSRRPDPDQKLQASKDYTPFSPNHSEPVSGSSSKQDFSPIGRENDQILMQSNRQTSLSISAKRPRIRYLETGDADFSDLLAPVPVDSRPVFQLEGVHDNRDEQSNRGGRASAPELNVGGRYGQFSGTRPTQETTNLSSIHDTVQSNPQIPCQICISLRGVVHRVVGAVDNLYEDLSVVGKGDVPGQHEVLNIDIVKTTRPLPQCPLDQALEWAMERLNSSIYLVKETLGSRTAFPPNIPDTMIYGERNRGKPTRSEVSMDKQEQEGRLEMPMNKLFTQQIKIAPRRVNAPQALPLSDNERRKSIPGDFGSSHLPYSPTSTAPSATSHSNFLQSVMQAPSSNRPLASPSSLNFSTSQLLPPLSPSFMNSKSPHTAHLQELQHQLSTKSLAHQILQGEHDKLLAAYSRLQTRCATLDKKSQVSDNEINNLVEDRIRLQIQADALEVQVEELQQSRDEAHKQSVANGSQYMQIMGMSSRLQAQAAADLKKWKTDRDEWQREKESLLSRIVSLENKTHGSTGLAAPTEPTFTLDRQSYDEAFVKGAEKKFASGDVLMSDSVDLLRAEILKLRAGYREAEGSLQAWRIDSLYLDEMFGKIGIIGERMRKRAIETNMGTTTSTE